MTKTVQDFHIVYQSGVVREIRMIHETDTGNLSVFSRRLGTIRIRKPLRWVRQYSRVDVDKSRVSRAVGRLMTLNYRRGLSAKSRILETSPEAFSY